MEHWTNFFSAIAGSAATLTGLIFVGVSISQAKVLAMPMLPPRAVSALLLLTCVLLIAITCLIPGQSSFMLGSEFLGLGTVAWLLTLWLDFQIIRKSEKQHKKHGYLSFVLSQFAVLPYIVAGVFILNSGVAGVYWLVPGIIFSFIKGVLDAWVLLIEIHR